jgi:hypothetical protein
VDDAALPVPRPRRLLTKLLTLINELNDNQARGNAYAAHALVRAILDHVPPILNCKSFAEVANNHGRTNQLMGFSGSIVGPPGGWHQRAAARVRRLFEVTAQLGTARRRKWDALPTLREQIQARAGRQPDSLSRGSRIRTRFAVSGVTWSNAAAVRNRPAGSERD